ncbi:hypothetical protein C1708_05445 [Streptomyces sp. DH-12]|uniref:hypothetical protein n=1 Tax=unclassified Streptomyces TaxID=2593676 RepID=UPI000CCF7575|nr:hypothetical protein [Streptomyces sp. DH-12]PNV31825.1 hypothetical protein C1708_05445 [Streptomyces sp. DH-12]
MTIRRTCRRAAVVALLSAPLLTVQTPAHAVELPPSCLSAVAEAEDKFPVQQFTVPDKVKSTLLNELGALGEADQKAFTDRACTAWNNWATANGPAVARDLDASYQNAGGPVCNKFTTAAMAAFKKYAPTIPAQTRDLETVAKKVWRNAMQELSAQATNATCRQSYDSAKTGW